MGRLIQESSHKYIYNRMLLRIHFALIPYARGNFWGWVISLLVNIFEGTPFNHVWVELKSNDANLAYDITGWSGVFRMFRIDTLTNYYVEDCVVEYNISQLQWDMIEKTATTLIGRKYAVAKMIMLSFARYFKFKWVAILPGVTCTESTAMILKSISLYDGEPGLAGLVEIEAATKTWKRIF
jgi:hypothetical protein